MKRTARLIKRMAAFELPLGPKFRRPAEEKLRAAGLPDMPSYYMPKGNGELIPACLVEDAARHLQANAKGKSNRQAAKEAGVAAKTADRWIAEHEEKSAPRAKSSEVGHSKPRTGRAGKKADTSLEGLGGGG
jgi:hypothetical protein